MKFYETHFEEYLNSAEKYNLHPELDFFKTMPSTIQQFDNMIVYGPCGSGKYTQVLRLLKRYSPSELKYRQKMTAITDKQTYTYHISDIHYEIDMSFLGCNSKTVWHDVFYQIMEIVSVKPNKIGIIVCKNFHAIHSELLEIFYSYIQQYNNPYMSIRIKFILLTEQLSFIPSTILNACHILQISKPEKEKYLEMVSKKVAPMYPTKSFYERIHDCKHQANTETIKQLIRRIDTNNVLNLKEFQQFGLVKNSSTPEDELPEDVFNTVCEAVIKEMTEPKALDFSRFRDTIYDILIYNLDATECIWYILSRFIADGLLTAKDTTEILHKTYIFLKYYNNNYRPIYHLESIMFMIIIRVHKINEPKKGIANTEFR